MYIERESCIYIYIYIYIHVYVYIYIYIYIYIYVYIIRYRTVTDRTLPEDGDTVSFHNFKSHNFKLSVSNPKSKYVAYLSVLSRISNCQGLGRKNKHDFLKTDRRKGLLLQGSASIRSAQVRAYGDRAQC